jgi:hypothetical protein
VKRLFLLLLLRWLKAVALAAFVAVWFSAFSFAARSFCAITAAINPTTSTKPWIFFFL